MYCGQFYVLAVGFYVLGVSPKFTTLHGVKTDLNFTCMNLPKICLDDLVVLHPEKTYFLRAKGESMLGAGISDGDLLVVEKAEDAPSGKVVIADIDGETTVKRLYRGKGRVLLRPENEAFQPIDITGREDVRILGIVVTALHEM